MKFYKDENWLYKKYWIERLSMNEISKICHCAYTTIGYWLRKHRIEIKNRMDVVKEKMSQWHETHKGENHPNWKGGKYESGGYVFVYKPDHPKANQKGYIREHRLVAEKALGRHLESSETVHHINGNGLDNRNKNLLICTKSYHKGLHEKMVKLYMKEHFGGI